MSAYDYQAFPKWVHPEGQEPRIVHTRVEEDIALGRRPPENVDPDAWADEVAETAVALDNTLLSAAAAPRRARARRASE